MAERTASVLDVSIEPTAIDSQGQRFDCQPPIIVAPHWNEASLFPNEYLMTIRGS